MLAELFISRDRWRSSSGHRLLHHRSNINVYAAQLRPTNIMISDSIALVNTPPLCMLMRLSDALLLSHRRGVNVGAEAAKCLEEQWWVDPEKQLATLGPTPWLVANRLKDQLTQQLQTHLSTQKQLSRIKNCTCGNTTQPESRLVRLRGRVGPDGLNRHHKTDISKRANPKPSAF